MIGNCHCGRIEFEIVQNPEEAARCECAYCLRTGWLTGYASVTQFRLMKGSEDLSVYYYGEGDLHHFFCSHCGINTHYFNDDTEPPHYAYNMGCVDDLDTMPIDVKSRVNHFADIPLPEEASERGESG